MLQTQQYQVGRPGKWVANMLQQMRTKKTIQAALDIMVSDQSLTPWMLSNRTSLDKQLEEP